MRPQKTNTAAVLSTIERLGTPAAREVAAALRVSQQTVSRLLAAVPDEVCRLGRTRGARYARVRRLEGLGSKVPLFRVAETGAIEDEGVLHLLAGTRHWLERSPGRSVLFDGLPPFIQDMSPQGFLGRTFAERHPDLALPRRTIDWSSDHLILAVSRRGEDLVGNLILGQESLDRHLSSALIVTNESDYPMRARDAGSEDAGSSAGGEHPKFLAFDGRRHLLVKFAAAGDAPEATRWRDLLVCEALALDVIREAGWAASEARVVDVDGMRFLEVVRFDRVGERGRVGVISLGAWDDAYLGVGGNWVHITERMRADGVLSAEDARAVRWLDTFGALIANTDRHRGNLAFFASEPERSALRLAPAYDMLPMFFAPRATGVETPAFRPPPPTAGVRDVWSSAADAALELWRRAAADARISDGFRSVAQDCARAVETERRRVAAMLG